MTATAHSSGAERQRRYLQSIASSLPTADRDALVAAYQAGAIDHAQMTLMACNAKRTPLPPSVTAFRGVTAATSAEEAATGRDAPAPPTEPAEPRGTSTGQRGDDGQLDRVMASLRGTSAPDKAEPVTEQRATGAADPAEADDRTSDIVANWRTATGRVART